MSKKTKVKKIYSPDEYVEQVRPFFGATVSAGFPSPAGDYLEGQLDLNKHLIEHPAATYFVRVTGESMVEAGIHDGDLLVVDRGMEPRDKNIVIANVDGELTVKRIRIRNKKVTLVPENESYQPRQINEQMEFEIWGIVKHVIHSV